VAEVFISQHRTLVALSASALRNITGTCRFRDDSFTLESNRHTVGSTRAELLFKTYVKNVKPRTSQQIRA